jgi:hypothetical protein
MVEPQDRHRAVEFQRAVLELHRFLFSQAALRLSAPR